jgi:membrane-bound metal-dependent hydrolase YbcI (DUF457 family)
MNSWKNHLLFGMIIEFLFIVTMIIWKEWYTISSGEFLAFFILIIILSPLIMDLDHKQSKLREISTLIGLSIGLIGIVIGQYLNELIILKDIGIILASVSFMLFYTTHHRGFTHSIPFCFLYGISIYFFTYNFELVILGIIGSYTHLIADKIPLKIV